MRNIAIIPVRAGSKRVKNKNYLEFFGKPMFIYTYDHALNSKLFDKIIISTESNIVMEICREYNIKMEYRRPIELSDGNVSLDDVCADVLFFFEAKKEIFDNMCLLWATAPMRDSYDIRNAYKILTEENTNAVIAVTDYYYSPYCAINLDEKGYLKQVMPEMFWNGSHAWPKTYVDCGSMAWVKVNAFKKEKTWMPSNSKPYYMPRYKSVDLDTTEDLELLKMYYQYKVLRMGKNE